MNVPISGPRGKARGRLEFGALLGGAAVAGKNPATA